MPGVRCTNYKNRIHRTCVIGNNLKEEKPMKRFLLIVLMVLAGVVLYSHANAMDSVPLPNDILIVPPDPSLPPEIKAFSGKWSGRWGNPYQPSSYGVDVVFVVEKIINEHEATAIYCWGDSIEWSITRGCMDRFIANFSQNEKVTTLSFKSRQSGNMVDFRVKEDKLEGRSGSRGSPIKMKRIQ
jgi:hypothetical protein